MDDEVDKLRVTAVGSSLGDMTHGGERTSSAPEDWTASDSWGQDRAKTTFGAAFAAGRGTEGKLVTHHSSRSEILPGHQLRSLFSSRDHRPGLVPIATTGLPSSYVRGHDGIAASTPIVTSRRYKYFSSKCLCWRRMAWQRRHKSTPPRRLISDSSTERIHPQQQAIIHAPANRPPASGRRARAF